MRRKLAFLSLLAQSTLVLAGLLAGGTGARAAAAGDRIVYSAGGEVRTTVPLAGDFVATGGHVIVDKPVGGDAVLAGGSVEVKARVGVDLVATGGDVALASTVGGDLLVFGGRVTLSPAVVVGGEAGLYASRIDMEGRIDGDLAAKADRIVIDGEVRGDVQVHAARVELGPKARIVGTLNYWSDGELVKAEGATVLGTVTREEHAWGRWRDRKQDPDRFASVRWIGGVVAYLGLLAIAAVFLAVAPALAAGAAQRVRAAPWTALGLGFATLPAVPLLAALLCITLLGIPLAMAVLALYPVALLLGLVVSVLSIARALPPAFRLPAPQSFGATMAWFAAALLLLSVVARIPFLGLALMVFVALAGLGGGVLELYARYKRPAAPTGGATAPADGRSDDMAGAQA